MIINNTQIKNFNRDEFPEDPVQFASPELIINLDKLRDFIGQRVYPSPVQGALARFDSGAKKSQHYAEHRLSTAIDIFVDSDPFEAYCKILQSKLFNRIGVYFDTHYKGRDWVLFHIDLKAQSLFWFRDESGYCYSYNKDFYLDLLKRFKK